MMKPLPYGRGSEADHGRDRAAGVSPRARTLTGSALSLFYGWRKTAFVIFLLAASAMSLFAQPRTTDPITLRAYDVGERLMCQCGCPYTVAGCNMTSCHFRDQIVPEIEQELRAGLSLDAVIEKMIAKYSEALRTAPRAEGFGLVGWAMPFITLLVGLAIVPFVVRKWKRSHAASVEARAPLDPAAVRRYEEEIEKNLAKFD